MSEKVKDRKKGSSRRTAGYALCVIAALLLIAALVGSLLSGTESSRSSLKDLRTQAVLHAASDGLVESIASQARSDKLKELRADKDFRKRGLDEVNAICDAAAQEARTQAQALYANPKVEDRTGLEKAIGALEETLKNYSVLRDAERASYSALYVDLIDNVADWTDLTDQAGTDDEALFSLLVRQCPALGNGENAHLKDAFVSLARDMSDAERKKEDGELLNQLKSTVSGSIADWSGYADLDGDALWDALCAEVDVLKNNERFRTEILAAAKEHIQAAANGETVQEAVQDEGADTVYGTQTNYAYFKGTETLEHLDEANETAYAALWDELVSIIPDLSGLSGKLQNSMRDSIEKIVYPGSDSFETLYKTYTAEVSDQGTSFAMRLSASAKNLLLLGVALLILGAVLIFWDRLTGMFGVPRTIITVFFIYLNLAAVLYNISVSMMLGDILVRMGMYGILVLAMMPGIQCGIGLNMGMTIGCIAGLLGVVMSLQFNMMGFGGLMFAVGFGVLVALPLGWAYSKLLNRMKGSEMTISTYVGFSFVALMCIGWMLLPFNNPKIIWLLSGRGLRVTHSLLNNYAHVLDDFLAFRILGVKVPTGLLLFFLVCCLLVWLFSRSKTGIAMTAVGSNPRFAEASGISVNRMRTIGTVLSTVIAAVGIVIYSQAFGYAQLYNAPRQLGFIAASAILIGGATVRKARVGHVIFGVFLFEGVLVLGQQIANAAVAGGGLSEVMRIMISNGIILYALTQSGGASRE